MLKKIKTKSKSYADIQALLEKGSQTGSVQTRIIHVGVGVCERGGGVEGERGGGGRERMGGRGREGGREDGGREGEEKERGVRERGGWRKGGRK